MALRYGAFFVAKMHPMTPRTFLFALLIATAALTAEAQPAANAPAASPGLNHGMLTTQLDPALQVTGRWLTLVDQGNVEASYNMASPLMKRAMTKEQWAQSLQLMRNKFGATTAREWFRIERNVNPQGMPPGEYLSVFTLANGEKRVGGAEKISLVLTNVGWIPVGYVVLR